MGLSERRKETREGIQGWVGGWDERKQREMIHMCENVTIKPITLEAHLIGLKKESAGKQTSKYQKGRHLKKKNSTGKEHE